MGTRRRFSFNVQREVIRGLKAAQEAVESGKGSNVGQIVETDKLGKFVGTSNVWFAMSRNKWYHLWENLNIN